MKYSRETWRQIYNDYVSFEMNEEIRSRMTGYQGVRTANWFLCYGYIDNELGFCFEVLACVREHMTDHLFTVKEPNNDHRIILLAKEVEEMEERIIDIHFPLEQINKSLAFILTSTNRIQLVKKGKQIYIQSNNNDVPVEAISTAEKNILGLVFFMVSTMQECKEKDGLIVLDDPISSTDEDHAYGIYSYLSRELKNFFLYNKSNKCICLSHDYTTFVNMSKVFANINKAVNRSI